MMRDFPFVICTKVTERNYLTVTNAILRYITHHVLFDPLDPKGTYNATLTNAKLVHWPLMGGLLHFVQRGEAWAGAAPPRPLLAVEM